MLVTENGDDVMKARLPTVPNHPRALMQLCEGLALWHGTPLCVAVSADDDCQDCFDRIFYGDELVEPASALVVLEHRRCVDRRKRIRGVGDFRQLRLLEDER